MVRFWWFFLSPFFTVTQCDIIFNFFFSKYNESISSLLFLDYYFLLFMYFLCSSSMKTNRRNNNTIFIYNIHVQLDRMMVLNAQLTSDGVEFMMNDRRIEVKNKIKIQ